jgi:photosystem II stability/assembly factor-like uncharacterized protein
MTTLTQASAFPATIFSASRGLMQDWLLGTNLGLWRLCEGELTQVAPKLADVHITTAAHTTRGVFVGAADTIARSMDGVEWTPVKFSNGGPPITQLCITQSFRTIGIAFAATLENGVLRTVDGGQTWTPCNLDQPTRDLVALAASPAFQEDYNIFAAFESAVFRGYKAGSTWERLPIPERALPATSIALTMRCIFVGSAEGLWRSDDGYTWDLVPETAGLPITALAMSANASWLAFTGGGRAGRTNDHAETIEWIDAAPADALSLAVNDDGEFVLGTVASGLWHAAAPAK